MRKDNYAEKKTHTGTCRSKQITRRSAQNAPKPRHQTIPSASNISFRRLPAQQETPPSSPESATGTAPEAGAKAGEEKNPFEEAGAFIQDILDRNTTNKTEGKKCVTRADKRKAIQAELRKDNGDDDSDSSVDILIHTHIH